MTNHCYTSKKMLWLKVAFILDRHGGVDKELSKNSIITLMSNYFPKQTPHTNSLTPILRPHVRSGIFEFIDYTTKHKTVRLIDEQIVREHSAVMERWSKIEN